MNKYILSLLSFFFCNLIFSQSQYDYLDDDVAHSKPFLDGYTILGLLILGLFFLIIRFIYNSVNNKIKQKEKFKTEYKRHERIINNQVIDHDGFICPTCGKRVSDNQYYSFTTNYVINKELLYCRIKYCAICKSLDDNYKLNQSSHIVKKELPDWYGNFTLILLLLAFIAAIIYGIIKKLHIISIFLSMFVAGIWAFVLAGIVPLVINLPYYFHKEVKPPFRIPSYNHAKSCNALKIISRQTLK